MRALLMTCIMLCFFEANGQEVTGNIKNHGNSEMDMVLMLFGTETPISIGKVDETGKFTANLSNLKIDQFSEDDISMALGDLYLNFFFSCADPQTFGEYFDKPALRQDFVRLTSKGEWAGTVFLVSDENLIPWIEDSAFNDAVLGTFYEIVYVPNEIAIKASCTTTISATEEEEVEVAYHYDLKLNAGFNWVEYTIEEVFETDPNIRASFPSKVKITNVMDASKMLWIGKYY